MQGKHKIVPAPKPWNVATVIIDELGISARCSVEAAVRRSSTPIFDVTESPSVHSIVSGRIKPKDDKCCVVQ